MVNNHADIVGGEDEQNDAGEYVEDMADDGATWVWPHPKDVEEKGAPRAGVRPPSGPLAPLALKAVETVRALRAEIAAHGAGAGGDKLAKLLHTLKGISGGNAAGKQQLAMWNTGGIGYACYKEGAAKLLVGILREGRPADLATAYAALSLAYVACDETIQHAFLQLGAVPALVKILTPDTPPFTLGCAADALSSLFNIGDACAEAVRCNALPALIAIVESCVPVVHSIVAAADTANHHRAAAGAGAGDGQPPSSSPSSPPPSPDIDPHRVAYTAVECIGGLAVELNLRHSCAAAVPVVGLYKLNPVVTRSLNPPGFNPFDGLLTSL
jgi:hypothetical protein